MSWWIVDLLIVVVYGLQHTLLTTKIAVNIYNKILPGYSWNFVYSLLSVATLYVGFVMWESSHVYLWRLIPGSIPYHISVTILAASLFFFFFCFKYTTSFWQWLGVKQIFFMATGRKLPAYYKIRKEGIKKYIRFPHHTCLVIFFWSHPIMTLDTLFLAIGATVYLYLGTYHQDLRGLRIIGDEWEEYRKNTSSLLFPNYKTVKRMWRDFEDSLYEDKYSRTDETEGEHKESVTTK